MDGEGGAVGLGGGTEQGREAVRTEPGGSSKQTGRERESERRAKYSLYYSLRRQQTPVDGGTASPSGIRTSLQKRPRRDCPERPCIQSPLVLPLSDSAQL